MSAATELRVLSVRHPWAWAIFHGGKDVENRVRPTRYRGPLLIHASRGLDPRTRSTFDAHLEQVGVDLTVPDDETLLRTCGGIVGVVEVVDCVRDHPSPWFMGPWGYLLRSPRPLPFHPCKGQVGLWRPPAGYDTGPVLERTA